MHQRDACMFRSRICKFHFKTDKVFGTDFLRCDVNDITRPHALCIEKNSFRKGRYGIRKPQCGDPEHRITLGEIYSIKTDNIDGYIIKKVICKYIFIISQFMRNLIYPLQANIQATLKCVL